jgi:PIN domain nuclease of toxin-antitoxin system
VRDGALLLDTCALIWLANGDTLAPAALQRISDAAAAGGVLVSPVSAWEIGLLARLSQARPLRFHPDPAGWFEQFVTRNGVALAPFTPAIAIAASSLPEPLHGDPADRLLVATARAIGVALVTRDARLLDYAGVGHVEAVRC